MMMNFRSAKKKKEEKKQSMLFAIVIALIILGFSGVYRWLSSGFHPLATPFWKIKKDDNTSLTVVFKDKKKLEKRILELEERIRIQSLEISQSRMLISKNNESSVAVTSSSSIKASILVKPNFTLYDTLIVDAGLEDGVQEGDIVTAYGLAIIGKVKDVRKNISFIEVFTEDRIKTTLVHNSTGTHVDVTGYGNGSVTFTMPRDAVVTVGDFLSSPLGNSYLFGTIENIKFDSTDPVQTILAQSVVNINQLQNIEIIPSYEEQF